MRLKLTGLKLALAATLFAVLNACTGDTSDHFDTLILDGTIYDGSGSASYVGDLGIIDGRIAAMGVLDSSSANYVINAKGKAVSPGFINMIGWGCDQLD